MILIFGGAYQGKLTYALERFGLAGSDVYSNVHSDVYKCRDDDVTMPGDKKIIYEIDKWILALVKSGMTVEEEMEQFINKNSDAIVICNDISCGVVPLDPVLRQWREATGRSMAQLSQNSEEVIRVFCGIPTRIKQVL